MIRKFPGPFVLLFVIAGIVLGDTTHASSWLFLLSSVLLFGAALYAAYLHRLTIATVAFAASIGSAVGFNFSSTTYDPGPYHVARAVTEPQVYQVFGRVSDWPDIRANYTEIRIDLDSIRGEYGRRVSGAVLLKVTDTTTALQRGDAVEFVGRIYPLRGDDDAPGSYSRRLTLRGVFGTVYLPTLLDVRVDRRSTFGFIHQVDRLREAIKASLRQNLSPASAALACGFLIGETRDIPTEVYTLFRDTGTLHLLAVSGSNVALVLLVVAFLLRPLGMSRVIRSSLLLAVIVIFSLVCYGEPSVIRASVMATLVIVARLAGRRFDLNNIIGLAALLILVIQPNQFFDVGFQLSFASAWGLIFIVPKILPLFGSLSDKRWFFWILFPVIVSIAAQVSSAPIILYYFRVIPLISPLANLFIVPMVSVSVIGIQMILVADLIWPSLGMFVGSLVDLLIRATLWIENGFGGGQWPMFRLGSNADRSLELLIAISALAAVVLLALSITRKQFRRVCLLFVCSIINVGLLISCIKGFVRTAPFVHIASVPGGVFTTVSTLERAPADCVLTGLTDKEYPVDQRVLAPIVNRCQVTKIKRLMVLSVAYDAVDELLAFSQQFGVDTLYLPAELKPMIQDAIAADSLPKQRSVPLQYFGGEQVSLASDGFHLSSHGIQFRVRQWSFQFLTKTTRSDAVPKADGEHNILIIGSPWQPSADDWLRVRKAGYDLIVCSRIVQYHPPNTDRADPYPDRVTPEYVHDLGRQGDLNLSLTRLSSSPGITTAPASQ